MLALAHVTGGGFPENLPRVLPDDLDGRARSRRLRAAAGLRLARARTGGVSESEMLRTFNCGFGMVVFAAAAAADDVVTALAAEGLAPVRIGRLAPRGGERVVMRGRLKL